MLSFVDDAGTFRLRKVVSHPRGFTNGRGFLDSGCDSELTLTNGGVARHYRRFEEIHFVRRGAATAGFGMDPGIEQCGGTRKATTNHGILRRPVLARPWLSQRVPLPQPCRARAVPGPPGG